MPDLRGTQGTFTLYTTRPAATRASKKAACGFRVDVDDDQIETTIRGPENPFVEDTPPLECRCACVSIARRRARVRPRSAAASTLEPGRMSDWITLTFRAAPGIKVSGICRLLLTEMDEHFSLYVTPINIDPDRPAMPISHPSVLRHVPGEADRQVRDARTGRGHLGAERGRHRRRRLPAAGLRHRSRARGDVLRRARSASRRDAGLCVRCDRPDPAHVLAQSIDAGIRRRARAAADTGRDRELYEHNDALVGRVMDRLRPTTCSWCCPTMASHRFGAASIEQLAARRGLSRAQTGRGRHAASGCAMSTGRGRGPMRSGSPACS